MTKHMPLPEDVPHFDEAYAFVIGYLTGVPEVDWKVEQMEGTPLQHWPHEEDEASRIAAAIAAAHLSDWEVARMFRSPWRPSFWRLWHHVIEARRMFCVVAGVEWDSTGAEYEEYETRVAGERRQPSTGEGRTALDEWRMFCVVAGVE